MAELQICLLGTFQVCRDFVPLGATAWRNLWAARLLKLILVRRPETVSAAEAAQLLGGGMTSQEFAATINHLQGLLEPEAALEWNKDGTDQIRFEPGPHCWIDLDALMVQYGAGLRAASRGDMLPAILAFQEADALYQGDLLEETQERWVLEPRRRLRDLYAEILGRLAEGHAVLARYQDAVGFCYKALAHDPLRETTYQRMIVYYYYLDDLIGAQQAYRACQEALEEAGRKVSPETTELWASLSKAQAEAAAAPDPPPDGR